jgi:aminomethyltransferase
MKSTPFTSIHLGLGAKMAEFAGYNMPIEYNGIINEHKAVCENVGVFDVSHMGEIWVQGPESLAFLQNLVSNDVSLMEIGQAQYSCLPNEDGGVVDDLLVYKVTESDYLVVVNASNVEKDWNWFNAHNSMGAVLENMSDQVAQLAVQGPKAINVLQKLTDLDLSQIKYYHFDFGTLVGVPEVLIANTGYTGAGGFEIYFPIEAAELVWNALFEAGREYDIQPIGLGARDTLRLEMGFCLYGHELDDTISPIEAGLAWATKFADGKNFPSRSIFEKQKAEGVIRKRIGLEMRDKGFARHGYALCDATGRQIGVVTSGSISPLSKIGIAMGYVEPAFASIGTDVFVDVRGKLLKAEVVKMPFRK